MDCQTIMAHISQELQAPSFKWLKVLKTLFLVEHLLKCGSTRCYEYLKSEVNQLRYLQNFSFIDEKRADKGESSMFIVLIKTSQRKVKKY